jgi:hypothetical protein
LDDLQALFGEVEPDQLRVLYLTVIGVVAAEPRYAAIAVAHRSQSTRV